jgi:DNA-binding IscR family transcriptional regulator
VRKLMMILREGGLVQSARGRSGGYALSAAPNQITVGHVFEALSGRFFDDSFCGRHSGEMMICVNSNACAVRSLWNVLDGLLWGVLNRTRRSDLMGPKVRWRRVYSAMSREKLDSPPIQRSPDSCCNAVAPEQWNQ